MLPWSSRARNFARSTRIGAPPTTFRSGKSISTTIFVMIIHVGKDQPAEMLFIDRDYMIQDLPAATSDPAFGHSVLPGRLRARWFGLQPCCLQERHHLAVDFRLPIEDRVTIRPPFRKCLAQLLHDPRHGRMTRD